MAAAFVRDGEVRSAFERVCWVSVGQEPDTAALQQTLYKQLVTRVLPEAATMDEQLALAELKEGAKSLSVLLVLDDVWVDSHATPLNFIEPSSTTSAVMVTTRIRSLLGGATEVQCEVMSEAAALELLLRTGGCEHLLEAPPRAAIEAVKACGRLPLALGIAGGMVTQLADTWQKELGGLLEEELEGGEASIEERVVNASLRIMPEAIRQDVERLFTLFSVFAEDAVVPAAAIDIVAPLMPQRGGTHQTSSSKRQAAGFRWQTRKLLQQLLKANLMRGSIDEGVFVHDLVRDCMIRRMETVYEGGLRTTQREAVPLLLAAFDASTCEVAVSYVAASLQWHVRQAQQPCVSVDADELLMQVLTHEAAVIRKQGALGISVGVLHATADVCDAAGARLSAARLMYAAGAVRGSAAGAEMRRAWESLRWLEQEGGATSQSSELEGVVLNALVIATDGGFAFGTAEHKAVMERMQELGRRTELEAGENAMQAEGGLGLASMMAAFAVEGLAAYPGPMTHETVLEAHGHWKQAATSLANAAAAAPDAASAAALWSLWTAAGVLMCPRHHRLAEFSAEELCGEGGQQLRRVIER